MSLGTGEEHPQLTCKVTNLPDSANLVVDVYSLVERYDPMVTQPVSLCPYAKMQCSMPEDCVTSHGCLVGHPYSNGVIDRINLDDLEMYFQ